MQFSLSIFYVLLSEYLITSDGRGTDLAVIGLLINVERKGRRTNSKGKSMIKVSGKIILPPKGADVTTMEGLKASIHLFEPEHFLFPFLAHALGTLVGFPKERLELVKWIV